MAAPKPQFWSAGSFRIMNAPESHDEIISIIGEGTHHHRSGDDDPSRPGKKWKNDIWIQESPIPEQSEIEDHLQWLIEFVQPYEKNITDWISRGADIDFYFSYSCDREHCGFGLRPELLEIFPKLGIKFEVSIMT